MIVTGANGRLRVIGDWLNCVECGERFYRRPQTPKICCDGGCQEARNRRLAKEYYQRRKEQKKNERQDNH